MNRTTSKTRCTAPLERSTNRLWGAHLAVPANLTERLLNAGSRRVVCTLNDAATFQCALIPRGRGQYVITVNKSLRDRLKVNFGDDVSFELSPDTSSHGHPIPSEWKAALAQDREGRALFQALSLGRQRTLLYIINRAKDPDKRIHRSLVILGHLKAQHGTIDYKKLTVQLRSRH